MVPLTAGVAMAAGYSNADEQRRPDVVAWQPLRNMRQYVFLDECGVTTDLLRLA